eukprot:jgi/Psemu1/31421/gm1.31421_g
MNTQFQPCIHYKRTFNVTEDHDSHKIVVDYARATNRSAGKKNIRRVQNLEVEEILYTYELFVDTCEDLGMTVNRWHTQWGQCLSRGPRKSAITPDPDAKGTMIAAFEDQYMAKPMDVLEHDHFSRIDTIFDYIDMLMGDDDADLTEQQRKRMFFKTHPRSWQDVLSAKKNTDFVGIKFDRKADKENTTTELRNTRYKYSADQGLESNAPPLLDNP